MADGLQSSVTPLVYDGYMSSISRPCEGAEPDDGTVLDAFVELLVADPDECDETALDELVGRSLRVRSWLDALDARIAVRAAVLAGEGRGASAVLTGGGRRARRDAEAAAARGSVCERMPQLGAALAAGAVDAGHIDAVASAARRLDDDGNAALVQHAEVLVAAAAAMSPEQFDREVRDLARNLTGDGGLSRHEQLTPATQRGPLGRSAQRDVQDAVDPRSAR